MQPGVQTSPRGLIALCVVFIAFGAIIFWKAVVAIQHHAYITELSRRRQIDGYEGLLIAACSVIIGVGGIWAVSRTQRGPGG